VLTRSFRRQRLFEAKTPKHMYQVRSSSCYAARIISLFFLQESAEGWGQTRARVGVVRSVLGSVYTKPRASERAPIMELYRHIRTLEWGGFDEEQFAEYPGSKVNRFVQRSTRPPTHTHTNPGSGGNGSSTRVNARTDEREGGSSE
jgi:hypothetical protein